MLRKGEAPSRSRGRSVCEFLGIKYVIIDVSSAVNKQGFPVSFQMKKEVRIEEFDNIIWTVNFTPSKHKDCYSFDNIGGECCDGWYD